MHLENPRSTRRRSGLERLHKQVSDAGAQQRLDRETGERKSDMDSAGESESPLDLSFAGVRCFFMNPFGLNGKVALITGGGTGLGKAMAAAMVAGGAKVVIVGRREEPLREAAAEIGEGATWMCHDVLAYESAGPLVEKITNETGAPDILVNNAGVHLKKDPLDVSEEEFLTVMNTHITGGVALTKACVPGMRTKGGGSIILISSMTALMGMPRVIAYSAAKSAVTGLVYSLTADLAPDNIRVNAIAPGWIDTPMLRKAISGDPERERKILSRTPMARFGEPEDVGHAAVYLASPAAKFVSGVILPIDGGGAIGF